ncbi:tetratricopeptide repeat protein [Nocardia seriolae]|uniref:tetratricopeptide repeat protein n=1 Tax=Nocardia seriolae TaxID=37332 RepID=UPI00118F465E|nr:tetratricopeptide repeat protein [Nocardia seriolae]GEM27456.1 hypothetical protein NS2_56950 [Nocardia seriolae NBRC 15557]
MSDKIVKARALRDLGRREGARELLAEALAADPDDADALAEMAVVCLQLGEFERALEFSESALRLVPEVSYAWRIRAHAAVRAADGAPDRSVERRELSITARTAARRALEINASEPSNHVTFALAYAEKDPTSALAAIDRALELDPESIDAFRMRAYIPRALLPDNDRAAAALGEILRLDPENAGAIHDLGRIDAAQGDLETAAARMLRAGQLNPARGDEIRRDLAWVRAQQALQPRPRPERSRAQRNSPPVLDQQVLEELRNCDAGRWHGTAAADIERAVAELAELRQAHPEDADILYESALADWLCGRRRAAITRLRKVSRLGPARAGQVEAHIATLEEQDQRAVETRAAQREEQAWREEREAESELERAAEQAIARRAARARAKARRGGVDLDAAVRVERPAAAASFKRHWLIVVPAIFLVKLSLHGCASSSGDHQPSVYTPPPYTSATMDPRVLQHLFETPASPPR